MDNNYNKIKESVRRELANFLGVDPEDIEDESSLMEDLHMKSTDLADFMEVLTRMDLDTANVNLAEIENFLDLVDQLTEHE